MNIEDPESLTEERAPWEVDPKQLVTISNQINERLRIFCSKDPLIRNSDLVLISDLLLVTTFKEFQDAVIELSRTEEDKDFPVQKFSRANAIKDLFTGTFKLISTEASRNLRNLTFIAFKQSIADILEKNPQSKLELRQLQIIFNSVCNKRHDFLTEKKKSGAELSEYEEEEIAYYHKLKKFK